MKRHFSLYTKLRFAVLLGILGLYILIFGIYSIVIDTYLTNNWIESKATIYKVDHEKEIRYISYRYFGSTYKIEDIGYSDDDKVGDLIVIYINPDNPNEINKSNGVLGPIIGIIVSGIVLIIAIILFKKHLKFMKIYKLCINEGSKHTLVIQSLEITNFSVNKRFYHYITVEFKGKIFKSHSFRYLTAFERIKKKVVDFYYIDDDTYYFDLSSVKDK